MFDCFKIQSNFHLKKIITEEDQINEVNDATKGYIEICTLFYTLFSSSRTACGNMTREIIEKLRVMIHKLILCWRNLRFSSKIPIIHGIEDHLLDQNINTME